tara:strand:- start:318 stop:521 length:204 start_codon:yes stop_codon:yes gene_type:complete
METFSSNQEEKQDFKQREVELVDKLSEVFTELNVASQQCVLMRTNSTDLLQLKITIDQMKNRIRTSS